MSVLRRIVLKCDQAGCERVHRGADNEPLSRVRLDAFGMDWNQRGGKDYCPLHDPRTLATILTGGAS